MKMELIEGSETSAINQTPGNYPKGNLLYNRTIHKYLFTSIHKNIPQ